MKHVVIVGARSAIATALTEHLLNSAGVMRLTLIARSALQQHPSPLVQSFQLTDDVDASFSQIAQNLDQPIDGVFVATGLLHHPNFQPEKSLHQISSEQFDACFMANTIVPALAAKYLCPLIQRERWSFFAAISARVGSISDNKLGGWYAYRASKAALNMVIKTLALEMQRSHKHCVVAALHPGTVATPLSAPFLSKIKKEQIMSPELSAQKLWQTLCSLQSTDSGQCFAFDGEPIAP